MNKTICENLAALLKVKTIVTLAVTLVFVVLALTNRLQSDVVMSIVTMVTAFYFGTQAEKQPKAREDAQAEAAQDVPVQASPAAQG